MGLPNSTANSNGKRSRRMTNVFEVIANGSGYVNLAAKSLTSTDVAQVWKGLRCSPCEVETLNLSGNDSLSSEFLMITSSLAQNNWLRGLNLGNCKLTVLDIKRLAASLISNNTLLVLNLGGNSFGNSGANHVAEAMVLKNNTLQKLYIREINIGV